MVTGVRKALVVVLLVLLVALAGCGRKQYVNLSYNFTIRPQDGELLKDVTVYLPFPTKDGKPVVELYKSLVEDYEKYEADEFPNVKMSLIKTKYGPMLKVSIPEVDDSAFGIGGGYCFEEPFSREPVAPRFPINPRFNPRKIKGHKFRRLCDSYIYVDFKNTEELGLAQEHGIQISSPSLLPLDYVPGDAYRAYLGSRDGPPEVGESVKYYNSKGWLKVPLAECLEYAEVGDD